MHRILFTREHTAEAEDIIDHFCISAAGLDYCRSFFISGLLPVCLEHFVDHRFLKIHIDRFLDHPRQDTYGRIFHAACHADRQIYIRICDRISDIDRQTGQFLINISYSDVQNQWSGLIIFEFYAESLSVEIKTDMIIVKCDVIV